MPRLSPVVLALCLLPSCLVDSGPPGLGSCAEEAATGASFGEIGIGTCLAGPVDMGFVDVDGSPWLVVANANPQENFETGSVLTIDWNSVDLTQPKNELGDLTAGAVPIEALIGGLGLLDRPDGALALVSDRLSAGTITQLEDDRAFVIDLSNPATPELWSQGSELELREDPGAVAVAADLQLAFVANLNDQSLSVIDTATSPLELADLGGSADITESRLFDIDGSGTVALSTTLASISTAVPDERWTMSWVGGSNRLFLPLEGGLLRVTGSEGEYRDGAFGIELDPEDPRSPHTGVLDPSFASGNELWFSNNGVIWTSVLGASATWNDTAVTFAGSSDWDGIVGGPQQVDLTGLSALYYDGRTDEDATSDIGIALRNAAGSWSGSDAPIVPRGGFDSLSDPWVVEDPFTRTFRMWMTAESNGTAQIALSTSDNGLDWSTPEAVTEAGLWAPVVRYQNGRYRMLASQETVDGIVAVEAMSIDGMNWVIDGAVSEDLLDAPTRVGIQPQTTGAWSVTGASFGDIADPVVAGSFTLIDSVGLAFGVAHGHLIGPADIDDTVIGVYPTSRVLVDGSERLYATVEYADESTTTAAFDNLDGRWALVGLDLVPGTLTQGLVAVADGAGWRAFYAAEDENGRIDIAVATSDDGLSWTAEDASGTEVLPFNQQRAIPHSATPLPDGGWRVWYSAFDGSRYRIGDVDTVDGLTFETVVGDGTDWQLGLGQPGALDDGGVRDPTTAIIDGTEHLWYAGSPNGSEWQLHHATRPEGTLPWTRQTTDVPLLFGLSATYNSAGIRSPLAWIEDGQVQSYIAGNGGISWRIGQATGNADSWFHAQNVPTRGDTIQFASVAGGQDADVIGLNQAIEDFVTTGIGVSSLTYDADGGRLFVTQRRGGQPGNYIQVLDVRDDSEASFIDRNAFDLESVVVLDEALEGTGIRDLVVMPDGNTVYATAQNPDAVVAVDISGVVDDDVKDVQRDGLVGSLPLLRVGTPDQIRPFADEDAGADTGSTIAGAGLALAPDGKTLLVAHYRDNSVVVIDTSLGAMGEEIRRISNIGENPHRIIISPDGTHAVVANYLGDVDDTRVSSTLAVIDIQPESPTYLEVVTWLVNR